MKFKENKSFPGNIAVQHVSKPQKWIVFNNMEFSLIEFVWWKTQNGTTVYKNYFISSFWIWSLLQFCEPTQKG